MTVALRRILDGKEYWCTHVGSSQYSVAGSSSACGLAAMNCVRYILSLERQGVSGCKLMEKLLLKETMEDIMSICSRWTSSTHLEVDDIYQTPLFQSSLKLVRTDYGRAAKPKFERMLSFLSHFASSHDNSASCALVITRPPEIVACLKIAYPPRDLFVVFDSHPRPAHPGGGAFFICGSMEAAVQHLLNLFPVDSRLLAPDSGLQWQAELLAHVSGHFFEFARDDLRMSQVVELAFLEATCAILSAKTQESEALSRCSSLASENERLTRDLERLEDQMDILRHEMAARVIQHDYSDELKHNTMPDGEAWKSYRSDNSSSIGHYSGDNGTAGTSFGVRNSAGCQLALNDTTSGEGSNHLPSLTGIFRDDKKGKRRASYAEDGDDLEIAIRMQLEFQAEDMSLATEMQHLQLTLAQETFDCSICMDQLPIDDVARLDGCEHLFCRNCIRQYISTKLDERKFPLPCPCCSTEKDSGRKGMVSVSLVHQIGISEKAYSTFNELQIAKFSIPIHCRRCNRSAFADKREFEQSKVLFCPFPNCAYSWCKDCQQEVSATSADGPIHSCDGSEELSHLMSRRGWKLCPGCKTPTEKTEGCNHMTCGSPGCNTHFCYICGGLIIRSSERSEINAQVKAHYRANCPLFHVPPEN